MGSQVRFHFGVDEDTPSLVDVAALACAWGKKDGLAFGWPRHELKPVDVDVLPMAFEEPAKSSHRRAVTDGRKARESVAVERTNLHEDSGYVANPPAMPIAPYQVNDRRLASRQDEVAGVRSTVFHRHLTHPATRSEAQVESSDVAVGQELLRDHLESLRRLVGGIVHSRCRKEADVVLAVQILHQRVDEPLGRRRLADSVLGGHHHIEAAGRGEQATLMR